MSGRTKIRMLTFLSALLIIAVCFAFSCAKETAVYRRFLSNSRQHAFAELTAHIKGLDSALQKGQYASSPSLLSSLCSEIYGRSMAAQLALGELPYSNIELEETAAFLSKTGDYTWNLSRSCANNTSPTTEQIENLSALAVASSKLVSRLETLQEELNLGTFSLEDVRQAEERLSSDGQHQIPAGSSFQTMEDEFPEVPTLIYDGPFSAHLMNKVPKYLEGKPMFDQEAACQTAASFLDYPKENLKFISSGEGTLPTYGFSLVTENQNLYLEVTRQGGVVAQLLSGKPLGQAQLPINTALAIAHDFLQEHNYLNMSETYFIRQGNQLVIHYAYQDSEVLCYPDLIKVTVSLDQGNVIGFEAHGFIMNHTERDLPPPQVNEFTARSVIAPQLEILSHQLALIPSSGEYEILCHEFKCLAENGQTLLIYINAETALEEKILLLLEDENGTLVK